MFTLSNGITVWLVQQDDLPLLSVRLILSGGASADPRGQEGLSYLTDQVVMRGAGDRDAAAFAAFAEQQAIDIGASTGGTTSVLYVDAHADKAAVALDLLADAALRIA